MDKTHQGDDAYTKQETEQRFKAIARAVLTATPIKRKDIPRKRRRQSGPAGAMRAA